MAATPAGRIAWLALDERDDDPVVFWTYLIAALQTAVDRVGDRALALLSEPHASLDEVLATLVDELDALSDDVVLVLDDYRVIAAREVHDRLAFLLERLPPDVRLVRARTSAR
ncbi:hypothetical protein [Geodermatophilus sp. SYSU D01119]